MNMGISKDNMWFFFNKGEKYTVQILSEVYKETMEYGPNKGNVRRVVGYIGYKVFGSNWMNKDEFFTTMKAAKLDKAVKRPEKKYVVEIYVHEKDQVYRMEVTGGLMSMLSGQIQNLMLDEGFKDTEIKEVPFEIFKHNEAGSMTYIPWTVKALPAKRCQVPEKAIVDFANREKEFGNPVHIHRVKDAVVDIHPYKGTEAPASPYAPRAPEAPNVAVPLVDRVPTSVLSPEKERKAKTLFKRIADMMEDMPELPVDKTIETSLKAAGFSDAEIMYALKMPEVAEMKE